MSARPSHVESKFAALREGHIADERVRARAERNQICRLNRVFGNASSTRHGGHYAANFGFM
jgi:hypothetical protein